MNGAIAGLLLLQALAPAEGSGGLTLEAALQMADRASSARAIALEVDRARAALKSAGQFPNPEISLGREKAGDVETGLTVSQGLPFTGRLSLERAAARRGVHAAEAQMKQARLELRARVREAFVDVLAQQERQKVIEAGLAQLDELVRVLRAGENEGESSGFDRMRSERERAEVAADLYDARARLAHARAALAAPLGITPTALTTLGALALGAPLPTVEAARAQASARSDLMALRTQAEQQDLLARAAARRVIPEPMLAAGRKTSEADGTRGQGPIFGLSLAFPLFDRGQGARAIAEAEGHLLRTRQQALENRLPAEAAAAVSDAEARREAEATYAPAADPDALVRIARAAYAEGEMRILELLDAYRTALAARLRIIELRGQARKAEIAIDVATGVERIR